VAPRLAAALAWWWQIRDRLAGQVPLLRAAVDRAAAGSDAWCAGHTWLGQASMDSADPAGALRHFTAVRDAIGDRGPFPLLARCLSGRSATLLGMDGSPRRPAMPAGPWPWPETVITRLPRRWPWRS
jgi:hypothetical protein